MSNIINNEMKITYSYECTHNEVTTYFNASCNYEAVEFAVTYFKAYYQLKEDNNHLISVTTNGIANTSFSPILKVFK